MFNVTFMDVHGFINDSECNEEEKNRLRAEINYMEENGIGKLGYNVSLAKCVECGRETVAFHVPQHKFPYQCTACGCISMYIDDEAEDKFNRELDEL